MTASAERVSPVQLLEKHGSLPPDTVAVKVNGALVTCSGVKEAYPPAIDGYNYFDISAGIASYAALYWYTL